MTGRRRRGVRHRMVVTRALSWSPSTTVVRPYTRLGSISVGVPGFVEKYVLDIRRPSVYP
jgi:hypothetical protein